MSKLLTFSHSSRKLTILLALSVLCVLLAGLDLVLGSVSLPLDELWRTLHSPKGQSVSHMIVWRVRLPRIATAMTTGVALSVSGLLMQTLFRNPIAGPYVLGVSSGASLGVAVLMLAGGAGLLGSWSVVLMAGIGAAGVLALMLALAWRVHDVVTLLIVGLMLGSATGAVVTLLQYFSGAAALKRFVLWSMGSLGEVAWPEWRLMLGITLSGLVLAMLLAKPLNLLLLGEQYAESLGLRLMRTRLGLIAVAAILAGTATAFCGPIAFIGIAAPHLARLLLRTASHQWLLPISALVGMALLLGCDLVAQWPGSEQQLPINAVTALIGAPIVIQMVLWRRS